VNSRDAISTVLSFPNGPKPAHATPPRKGQRESEGGGGDGDECARRTDAFRCSGAAASARRARASPCPRCRAELPHWRAERMEPSCDTARAGARRREIPVKGAAKQVFA